MDKNLPANAGDTSLISDPWRSHHLGATKPTGYNYWAHALEPAWCTRLEPVFHNERRHRNEKPVYQNWSSPSSPQLEKACMKQQRPSAATKKKKNLSGLPRWLWQRIYLQMQELQVQSLGQEDLKIFWRRKWQPIQYSCKDNPMDRGARRTTVYGVGYNWACSLARTHTHTHTHTHTLVALGHYCR